MLDEFEDIWDHVEEENRLRVAKRYIRDAGNPIEMFSEGGFMPI